MIDKLLKVDSTKDNLVDQIEDLQERISELERFALTSQDIVVTKIDCSGDIYTVQFTEYSATSTIVGWSSFSSKYIRYKKIGKLMFVQFYLTGESDDTATTFTLPYSLTTNPPIYVVCKIINGGAAATIGLLGMAISNNVVYLYPAITGGPWSASGGKEAIGQFWYEVD